MSRLGRFARELRWRLFKPRVEQEVDREVDFHLDMSTRELMARGLGEPEARAEARRRFGDVPAIAGTMQHLGHERDEAMERREWLADLGQDIRVALRQLRTNPGFAVAAVLTLALGIGASTTIFSVANAVLFRAFPYEEPDKLVAIFETNPNAPQFSVSEPNYLDFTGRNRAFSGLAAFLGRSPTIIGEGDPERLAALAVTPSFFPLLGITALAGRTFTEAEGVPGAPAGVVLISRRMWATRFASDPAITSRSLNLDGTTYQVAGVVTDELDVFRQIDVWLPFAPSPSSPRNDHRLSVLGRLRPGVTPEQGIEDLQRVARELGVEYPASNKDWGAGALTLGDWIVGPQLRTRLQVLLGGVALLLLMACVNVANLLMARAGARGREMSVRAALGAGRWRIARQLLTESLVLSLLGAAVGVAFAYAAVPALRRAAGNAVPRLATMTIDARVLLFGIAAALLTGLLFGAAPAFTASRVRLHEALRAGLRIAGGGRLRSVLIAASVALATVLLAGAALIGNSFLRLTRVDPGFDAQPVMTATIAFPRTRYQGADRVRFVENLLTRLEALPGIAAAGTISSVPLVGGNTAIQFAKAGSAEPGTPYQASWRAVSPGYFATMGIRLLAGRVFTPADRVETERVIMITETMARQVWPGENAVGQRIRDVGVDWTVVGVVNDTRDGGLAQNPAAMFYMPYAQAATNLVWLTVRARAGDPLQLVNDVRSAVREQDAMLSVNQPQAMAQIVIDNSAQPRLTMLIFALFAAAALALALVGVYGIVAYSVAQRTREIGVRMALGARAGSIVAGVLRRGMLLSLAGVAAGTAAAWLLSRYLRAILFGIEPTDAASYAATAALLIVCAGLATLIPARRAARLQPTVALREE